MSTLPYDSRVEYLESTGTQYIDTGISLGAAKGASLVMENTATSNGDYCFIGVGDDRFRWGLAYYINGNTKNLQTSYLAYQRSNCWYNDSLADGSVWDIEYNYHNEHSMIVNGSTLRSNITTGSITTGNIYIFAFNYGGNSGTYEGKNTPWRNAKMRLYSCKITDNGVVVMYFIPVRVGQVGYLYDTISGELFGNAGTGSFTLGPDYFIDEPRKGIVSPFRRHLLMSAPPPIRNYLCFTALEDGTFSFRIGVNVGTGQLKYISYSIDNGVTWIKTDNIASTEVTITTPTIPAGRKVLWKGEGTQTGRDIVTNSISNFSSTGRFNVSGLLLSLVKEDDITEDSTITVNYQHSRLFTGCSNLVSASQLILAPNTRDHCYNGLFLNCSSLIDTPSFPNTTTASLCYQHMFNGCSSLLEVQEPLYLTDNTRVADNMFNGCSSLLKAPDLTPTTLARYAYNGCFRYSGVKYIKMLGVTIGSSALSYWVQGVPNTSDCIFVKHIDATWTDTGNNGVPTNWTVIYYDPELDKYYTD